MRAAAYSPFIAAVLAVCASAAAARSIFSAGTRSSTPADVARLSAGAGVTEPALTAASLFSHLAERASANESAECASPFDAHRTIALAGTFGGPVAGFTVRDTDTGTFFRTALGWGDEEIEQSRQEARLQFKSRFGIDTSNLKFRKKVNGYAGKGVLLASFYFDFDFYKTADSAEAVPCATTKAVWGGWAAIVSNYNLTGDFGGPQGVYVSRKEEAFIMQTYMVFSPGSPNAAVLKTLSSKPLVCADTSGLCGISEEMELLDDSGVSQPGFIDGTLNIDTTGAGDDRVVTRFYLSWPGRF